MRSFITSSCCGSGLLNAIGTGLPASDRRLGLVFGEADRALDAAGLRPRDIAGDATHHRVVVGIDDDLVVGSDQLEDGVDLADLLGAGAERQRSEQGQRQGAQKQRIHRTSSGGM
jgi:hypothetical protein